MFKMAPPPHVVVQTLLSVGATVSLNPNEKPALAGGSDLWRREPQSFSASWTRPTISGPGRRVLSPSSFHLDGQPSSALRVR